MQFSRLPGIRKGEPKYLDLVVWRTNENLAARAGHESVKFFTTFMQVLRLWHRNELADFDKSVVVVQQAQRPFRWVGGGVSDFSLSDTEAASQSPLGSGAATTCGATTVHRSTDSEMQRQFFLGALADHHDVRSSQMNWVSLWTQRIASIARLLFHPWNKG